MEFQDSILIDAPVTSLWELVSDPEVLASCVPGAKEVEKLSETKYRGIIERGLAGVSMTLDGTVEIVEMDPPNSLTSRAIAEDLRTNSAVDANLGLELGSINDDGSELTYHIDIEFTGRLATVGARIVKRKISSDIQTFIENLRQQAEAPPED